MNKNKKRWLNYSLGIVISLLIIWSISNQVKRQLSTIDFDTAFLFGPVYLPLIAFVLLVCNIALEALRWKLLASSAEKLSYIKALGSCLAGYALSVITPNRIGEYPGRILYLKRKNTIKLISVSVLGAFAQLFAVLFFGFCGLVYYNIKYDFVWAKTALIVLFIVTTLVAVFYLKLEVLLPRLGNLKILKRFNLYSKLLQRFSGRQHSIILGISVLRYMIYASELLVLLCWFNVCMPVQDGFFLAALFFCAMAVIPTIAFVELGLRAQVGLFLFGMYSGNSLGILAATMILWMVNLMLPASIGSLLMLRTKFIR